MLKMVKQILLKQSKRMLKLSMRWKIFIAAIVFSNLALIAITLCVNRYRALIGLFYYSFLSNSPISWIVPLMPQEPMLLLYGTLYSPLVVALTAGIATFLIELINYQVLVPVCALEQLKPFKRQRVYRVLEHYFHKIPFAVITFVGLTPIPHLPFRFLAVLTGYPVLRYALASFVGRSSFYYVVALTGAVWNLPPWVYMILLLGLAALALSARGLARIRRNFL